MDEWKKIQNTVFLLNLKFLVSISAEAHCHIIPDILSNFVVSCSLFRLGEATNFEPSAAVVK